MNISSKTKLYGLFGSPVEHSMSPNMYNLSFEKWNLDSRYLAFDIPLEKTKDAVEAFRTLGMKGANITMPCKAEVTKYVDRLSPAAEIIGACNTIVEEDGVITGYITDGMGYVRNLKENGVSILGKKLTLLGAGGAATAILVQCALDGIREVAVFNQKDEFWEKAQQNIEKLKGQLPGCRIHLHDLADEEALKKEIGESQILSNATRIGMAPYEDISNIKDLSVFRKDLVVTDVVYHPVKTRLLQDAQSCGCKVIGGLGMLLYQGAEAFKLYSGKDMPVEEVKAAFFSE